MSNAAASAGLPANVVVFERGWLSSNNILFVGEDETALVDTGYATHAEQTLALVESALGSRPLDRVLNTHLHSDHCGGNAALQLRYPALRTDIPPGEATLVERWDERGLSFLATGQTCPRFRFTGLLQPGTECRLGDREWEVHSAPGHDPHSIILSDPVSRTLISADALWENGFGIAFPELAGEPSFGEIAATLDCIEKLAPLRVIPGHGRVFHDIDSALATARRRLGGLQRDPAKHARHAIKVLMKFKLLETQHIALEAWSAWLRGTPYLETIRLRFFADEELDQLTEDILAELIAAGAAERDALGISNT
ncbi:glyoxylase-like metal-dependent hydrolase (beta-lactamase superfamily II) [Variovorax boronicumulans]|uniref:Glyoxylase-like metal-dependent hydrolase (Beta-lactamase superfamily II) n=1 Tax=Variovorax boronicumulans TaxID=436515 RepID=A0AAW8CX87_9BURK|nr:MBL fold metallo-hydrolase [Variovorax boronicumulans]MDP9892844.1 glyoxylase-like metal-dependent hydrolase (beta-lactamase superfamily II) [Variovorax boronicumulans]MDQ0051674.1 glyoxylase-like metal-dependent hydrolase (beta-lactamase superfamily II) [Variovorax boronicumulans]